MYLAREVMDKEIADRDGLKAGKVDDLLLEIEGNEPPIVRAIVTQRGALSSRLGRRAWSLTHWFQTRVVSMSEDGSPIEISWDHVTAIDVAVHIDLEREAAHLLEAEAAVWERVISHLPFSGRRET